MDEIGGGREFVVGAVEGRGIVEGKERTSLKAGHYKASNSVVSGVLLADADEEATL
jgi:hypothetical protein